MIAGLGETIYDILFDAAGRPLSAHPGGSVYNALISLVRDGQQAVFVGETGDDLLGHRIAEFLQLNRIDTSCLTFRPDVRTQLSIAFLDNNAKPSYQFYNDYPSQRLDFRLPELLTTGDAFLFGSFFALNPAIADAVLNAIRAARNTGALLYYDVNFRASHSPQARELMPAIYRNMDMAHIVKASDEDLRNIFGPCDETAVYNNFIRHHCPLFLCTAGDKGATLHTPQATIHVDALSVEPVSTIGAGDAFNAGVLARLVSEHITTADLALPQTTDLLHQALLNGVAFASEVCLSLDNCIAPRR